MTLCHWDRKNFRHWGGGGGEARTRWGEVENGEDSEGKGRNKGMTSGSSTSM